MRGLVSKISLATVERRTLVIFLGVVAENNFVPI